MSRGEDKKTMAALRKKGHPILAASGTSLKHVHV